MWELSWTLQSDFTSRTAAQQRYTVQYADYEASLIRIVRQYLINVSTCAAYMWSTMGPERATYGLTKNAGTALLQRIAQDVSSGEMQIVSFHPGGLYTNMSKSAGITQEMGIPFDDGELLAASRRMCHWRAVDSLPGHFAVWAATSEAKFLHGRFCWANWDIDELRSGQVTDEISKNSSFLRVGIEGLSESMGHRMMEAEEAWDWVAE
jgi:NAD(P)-dependent dehydrogenase (short-subunit alcohol dehydrogenase family)